MLEADDAEADAVYVTADVSEPGCGCLCLFGRRAARPLKEPLRLEPDSSHRSARAESGPDDVLRSSRDTDAIKVLEELNTTERAYVGDLERLHAAVAECMPRTEVDAVAASLLQVHKELLLQLDAAGMRPSLAAVAACFGTIAPFLRMYSMYCAAYPQALERVGQVRSADAEAVAALESAAGGERIESLLIKPVQRLCKYPLLVRTTLRSSIPSPAAACAT